MMNGGATVPKTRWMHTDEVKRAALILGIIEDYSRASVFKVNLILKRRLADERIVKEKHGERQTSPAFYAALLDCED